MIARKNSKLIKLAGIICAILASGSASYAGMEGNIGFCVYADQAPAQDQNNVYIVKQSGKSRCFEQASATAESDSITYPEPAGKELARINITHKGLNCSQAQQRHYQVSSTVSNQGKCAHQRSYSPVTIANKDKDQQSDAITFNFGSGKVPHTMGLYESSKHGNGNSISASRLQLSTRQALSGTTELQCPLGWCTNGKSPGSTMWVIWSPDNSLGTKTPTARQINTAEHTDNYEYFSARQAHQDCAASSAGKYCKNIGSHSREK